MFAMLLSFTGLDQALHKGKTTYQKSLLSSIRKALQAGNKLTGNEMLPS